MVQVKPADADRLLSRPDDTARMVLLYGDDEGLVAERAEKFARAVTGADGEHVRLDPAVLSENPGRIADEAHSIPMFGGKRAISLRMSGNRAIEKPLQEILDHPPVDAWVIVTAGELRKTSPLRKLAETSGRAWAIACYADGERDLDRIIDEETHTAGLTIANEARTALRGLIGGDRMVSRSEIQKLTLYATGKGEITLADVEAVIGDSGAFATDEAVDAIATGDAAALDVAYRRLVTSGTPGFVIAGAALRHFNFLQRARSAVDAGDSPEGLVRRAVPPIYPFSRQSAVARQIERWSSQRVERALAMMDQSMLDSRIHGNLADEIVGQTLQLVAAMATGGRRAS